VTSTDSVGVRPTLKRYVYSVFAITLLSLCLASSAQALSLGYVGHNPTVKEQQLAAWGGADYWRSPMVPLEQQDNEYNTTIELGMKPVYVWASYGVDWVEGVDRRYPEAVWQVGNEPNKPQFRGNLPESPRLIAQLVKRVQIHTQGRVIAPALSGCPGYWLRKWKKHDMNKWSDAIALNLYPGLNVPTPAGVSECVQKAKRIVGGKVWVTETGYASSFDLVDQARKAEETWNHLKATDGVPVMIWYRARDNPFGSFRYDYSIGTVTFEYVLKPAYHVLAELSR
jgi:hypothetical protein